MFVLSSLLAIALSGSVTPLLTQLYQDNYPDASRSRYLSRTVMIRIGSAVVFAGGAGYLLSLDFAYFRILLAAFAGALAFSSWCLSHVPVAPFACNTASTRCRAFRYVGEDRVFRITLISWMFMGFANLMMLPLRVELLANPRYALALRPDMIALLTGVVPNLARLVMSPVWGWLFDRMNFFVMRMTLNVGFAVGIISFFASDTTMGFVLAAVTFGIATAGGDVAWTLWVTEVSPPERVPRLHERAHVLHRRPPVSRAPRRLALVSHWPMTTMGWFSAAWRPCWIAVPVA